MSHCYLAQIPFEKIKPTVFPNPDSLPRTAVTLSDLISKILPYVYTFAGITLFIFLVLGGFAYLTSAGDPKKAEGAQKKITSALVGFLIIFLSYWLAQILEIIFNIQIF